MTDQEYKELIEKLHKDACARQETTYIDPKTGYTVFTEINHLKRGSCCQSGCRHCPWQKNKQYPKH